MSKHNIPQDALDVIKQSNISANVLTLPDIQLERRLYESVQKTLKLAGGKWDKKSKGFLFSKDPSISLGLVKDSGFIIDKKKVRQAYYTPYSLALDIAKECDLEGYTVLEPSAGDGNLAKACLEAGASFVICVEQEPECLEPLSELDSVVLIADFLTLRPNPAMMFDRIVMNPPFNKGQYWKHIKHALNFLSEDGCLYAVVPDNNCPKIKEMNGGLWYDIPAGAFKESGTMIKTILIKIDK